jgi:chaperonin GroES
MQLVPLFDQLLVKVPDEKKETDGGIVLPDTHSADRPQRGTVISRGEDVKVVQVGDEVVFRRYSPDIVEIDGEKFWILKEEDVIARIS